MDAGNHPSHPAGTVRHYLADWWNKDVRPRPVDILNIDILLKCLNYHRDEEQSTFRSTTTGAEQRAERQLVPGIAEMPCPCCVQYREVAMDGLHDLHDIRNHVQANEAIRGNHVLLTDRRAAGFNTLYEKALFKETDTSALFPAQLAQPAPSPAPSVATPARRSRKTAAGPPAPNIPKTLKPAELAELVRENSETQWKRLQEHLEQHAALKWTWGVDIQDDEIKHMVRATGNNFQIPHTGYNSSLGGPIPGDSTVLPALPTPSERDCHTRADVPDIPELGDTAIPTHFNDYPLRRLSEHIPSQKLPMVPKNYVPNAADANDRPATGTLKSLTAVSMLHVQAAQSMRAQGEWLVTPDSQPMIVNNFSAAAALKALESEESTSEFMTMSFSGKDALQALGHDYSGAKEMNTPNVVDTEDQTWDELFMTNISIHDALEALQTEYKEPDVQAMVVQDVSGADALQALQDDSPGAGVVVDTEPIVIEDSDEDLPHAYDVSDRPLIVIEDSDDAGTLDYIEEQPDLSFLQLATENDLLAEQSVMITQPVTAAEALEALQADHRPVAQQTLMPSMWTAADFRHCITPDDLDSEDSE